MAQTPSPDNGPVVAVVDPFIQAALSVCDSLDRGQGSRVWEMAGQSLQNHIRQTDFAEGIQRHRQQMGALRSREWAQATRLRLHGQTPPSNDGLYTNVLFISSFANQPVVQELVTYRLEGNQWRLAGYRIDMPSPSNAVQPTGDTPAGGRR